MGNEDVQKKIDEIEAEMARTQKNKATNYHLGTLKAKLAKLRSELINGPGGKSAGSKDSGRGFDVSKSGDTRIGLGKSLFHILQTFAAFHEFLSGKKVLQMMIFYSQMLDRSFNGR